MKKITIAIDGFSSTGKSTLAKLLATKLNYIYVDTGAMYRAVTYFAFKNGMIRENFFDTDALISSLKDIHITFKYNPKRNFAEVHLNGNNIEDAIRTLEVSKYVSQVATLSEVRRKLVKEQQAMGKAKGVVMDGRDIATVVFPNAELKLFLTAFAEVRAKRRYDELLKLGHSIDYNEVLENITTRDFIDSNREDSPLVKANDAIEIDNSELNIDQQLDTILSLVNDLTN